MNDDEEFEDYSYLPEYIEEGEDCRKKHPDRPSVSRQKAKQSDTKNTGKKNFTRIKIIE